MLVCVHAFVRECMHVKAGMRACVHVCMHASVYVSADACVHVCMCLRVHMRVWIHTHLPATRSSTSRARDLDVIRARQRPKTRRACLHNTWLQMSMHVCMHTHPYTHLCTIHAGTLPSPVKPATVEPGPLIVPAACACACVKNAYAHANTGASA